MRMNLDSRSTKTTLASVTPRYTELYCKQRVRSGSSFPVFSYFKHMCFRLITHVSASKVLFRKGTGYSVISATKLSYICYKTVIYLLQQRLFMFRYRSWKRKYISILRLISYFDQVRRLLSRSRWQTATNRFMRLRQSNTRSRVSVRRFCSSVIDSQEWEYPHKGEVILSVFTRVQIKCSRSGGIVARFKYIYLCPITLITVYLHMIFYQQLDITTKTGIYAFLTA